MERLGGTYKKVNLVVRLYDDYNLRNVTSPVLFKVNDIDYKPIKKSGGYFVFINMEQCNVKIQIKSEEYFSEILELNLEELNQLNPVINLRLKPKPNRFFKEDDLIIRFKVLTKSGMEVEDALIGAYVSTIGYSIGKLEKAIELEDELSIYEQRVDVLIGDVLALGTKENQNLEFITIEEKLAHGRFRLKGKTKYLHSVDERLRKAIQTRTDSEGNGLIYFTNMTKKDNKITILVKSVGKDEKGVTAETEVNCEGFEVIKIGKIIL